MNKAQAEEDEEQDRRDLDQHHDVVGSRRLANAAHQDDWEEQYDKEGGNVESGVPTAGIDVLALQVLQAKWQVSRRQPHRRQRYSYPIQQRHQMSREAYADAHVAEGVLE